MNHVRRDHATVIGGAHLTTRLAESDVPPEKEVIHYTGSINLISEWSEFGVYDFADFICSRNHTVDEAVKLDLDVRYGNRDVVDRMNSAREAERRTGFEIGDRKAEFHSEISALRELRATIKPVLRSELFRTEAEPALARSSKTFSTVRRRMI